MKTLRSFIWNMLVMSLFSCQSSYAQVREIWVSRYPEGDTNTAVIFASALDRSGGHPVATGVAYPGSATIKYDKRTGVPLWIARVGTSFTLMRAIVVDVMGDILIAGGSSPSPRDYLVVKLNGGTGQYLWQARYDGPANSVDDAQAAALDQDGNVYVTGYSTGNGTQSDYATVKYDGQTGQQLWAVRYSTPEGETAYAIAVDPAGNVFVTGTSGTIKYNGQTGQMLWGPKPGKGRAIALDDQGNALVTGGMSSGSGYTTFKYDGQTGQQLWTASANNLGGTGLALAVDPFGDVYVAGSKASNERCLVIKYSGQTGLMLWSRELPGTCNTLRLDQESHVYVAGTSIPLYFPGPSGDFRSAKIEGRTGQVLWQTTHIVGLALTMQVDDEGNVYVAGHTGSDWPQYLIIKYEQAPPGDVNFDFCVDDGDLLHILDTFGQSGELPEDVNRDGTVDDQDLLTVLFNFGRGCGEG
jgi:hypothetical protein